ncbi:hypothetical protein ACFOON_02770 [Novosphingobium piscinae]|uniref:Uncharacterized protein n=1 Tax=Novosphingobium piscinae TaxID=1507448 RepID=A0A7X1KRB5_9SPHN|nr:hypothetical protein [Novosphingobium piscinae]MBC2670453.1 hypothetical protein [Novosphingobium piscinae]
MMRVRAGVGWQYALADLSLILFMVCAAALAREQKVHAVRPPPPPPPRVAPPAIALADPVAVWRAGPGMPSLQQWLASQTLDPRQRLTVVAHYTGGRAQLAFARAETALRDLPRVPPSTRIVVEPAATDDLSATLTWDVGGR